MKKEDNGKETRFKSGSEAARKAGSRGGSSPKRKQTLDTKRLMKKLLLSTPPMTAKIKDSISTIGVDSEDDEMITNAGLIAATIIAQALNGDRDAARMAFEMAGEYTNTRDIHDKQKIAIEKMKAEADIAHAEAGPDEKDAEAFRDIVDVFRERLKQ